MQLAEVMIYRNALNGEVVPPGLASRGWDTFLCQLSGDGMGRHSSEEVPVNPADDFRLRFVYDQPAVGTLIIAQKVLVVQAELAVADFLPLTPAHVFGNAAALFLGKTGHDGQKNLPIKRLFDTITFCTRKGQFCTLLGAPLIDSAPKAQKERLLRHLEETLSLCASYPSQNNTRIFTL